MTQRTDEEVIEEFDRTFCTTVGDGEITVVRWLNDEDNAKLTGNIVKFIRELLNTKNQQITAAKAEERAETIKAAVSAIEGERKPVPLIEDDEEAYHACRDFNNGLTAAITAVEEVGKNESV